jgi:hypothetical protein
MVSTMARVYVAALAGLLRLNPTGWDMCNS